MSGNITHGMSVEDVRNLGQQLQTLSGQIGDMVNQLNSRIGSTSWVGADASMFKDQWWPEHRNLLTKVQADLHGFGQSALNNATEQEDVSSR